MITGKKALEYVRGLKRYCCEQLDLDTCNKCMFYKTFISNKCPISDPIETLERIDGKPL